MESGEGIESTFAKNANEDELLWNPVKELKDIICGHYLDVPVQLWNPVKELKGKPFEQLMQEFFGKWNPVKELKDVYFRRSVDDPFHVESGEGIESILSYSS